MDEEIDNSESIMFIGDTHGDLPSTVMALRVAYDAGIKDVIQLGDWGFRFATNTGRIVDQVGALNNFLVEFNIHMRWCHGNHDIIPWVKQLPPTRSNVASNITYMHSGSFHEYASGIKVVFVGGATSIDYRSRTEYVSWWADEQVSLFDLNKAVEHKDANVDVVASHDGPLLLKPPLGNPTIDYRTADNQKLMRWIVSELAPKLVIHGHWHLRENYRYKNIPIIALNHVHDRIEKSYFIYNKSVDLNNLVYSATQYTDINDL